MKKYFALLLAGVMGKKKLQQKLPQKRKPKQKLLQQRLPQLRKLQLRSRLLRPASFTWLQTQHFRPTR